MAGGYVTPPELAILPERRGHRQPVTAPTFGHNAFVYNRSGYRPGSSIRVVAAAPQLNRYSWLLAGATAAIVLLLGRRVLANAVTGLEGLFRDWVVSGAPYDRPLWAVFIESFTAVVVVAFAGGVLPRSSRKTAILASMGLIWGLLLLEIALLSWLGAWTRLLLPVIALLAGRLRGLQRADSAGSASGRRAPPWQVHECHGRKPRRHGS